MPLVLLAISRSRRLTRLRSSCFVFFFGFFFFFNLLIDSQIWSDLRQSPAGGAPRQQLPGDGFDLGLVQSSAPCQGTEFFFDLFQYFFFTEFFFFVCFSPPSITRRFSWQARRSSRFASLFVFLFAWTWTWADDVLPSFTEFYRVFFCETIKVEVTLNGDRLFARFYVTLTIVLLPNL